VKKNGPTSISGPCDDEDDDDDDFLVVAVIAAAANALVLYALIASKQHRKHVLMFNQNALDFFNCLFLVAALSVGVSDVDLGGTLGRWICLLVLSKAGSWGAYVASVINFLTLVMINLNNTAVE